MESIKARLAEMGIATTGLSDDQIKKVAAVVGVSVPRSVEIVAYNGASYLKTQGYEVPAKTAGGKPGNARGLFIRVEAMEAAVKELQAGIELAKSKGLIK